MHTERGNRGIVQRILANASGKEIWQISETDKLSDLGMNSDILDTITQCTSKKIKVGNWPEVTVADVLGEMG